jgi:hypothetical protein
MDIEASGGISVSLLNIAAFKVISPAGFGVAVEATVP